MLEYINENNVWDFFKKDGKPVVIYGMGNASEKIISILTDYGIEVSDIFASDEFVRGHSFLGRKVLTYSDICQKYDDFNVVLAFATHLDNMLEKIKSIDGKHSVFAPDIPVAGGGLFTREYVEKNEKDFDFVFNRLADDESRRVYKNILNFKISGKISYLFSSFCDKDTIYRDILKLTDNEAIVDLGAYNGDTIAEFTSFTKGKYNRITALEPDKKNFNKLIKNTQGMDNITALNMGAWNKRETLYLESSSNRNSHLSAGGIPVEVTDIDSIIDFPVTMIKMDIEGAEMKALNGAEKIIKKYHPKLYICAYHRNEDMFALGKKIYELNDNYKLYFRHSKYIPAWESNFYAVEKTK
ncbi:MAG: FkbM family methyltransferase [Clostridiales bacterium]|nr:FkbM family methyltransferase [Clostridiales bacterium]